MKITSQDDPRVQTFAGKKFNRLTAVRFIEMTSCKQVWEFKCDCGLTTVSAIRNVISGNTKSCGCFRLEATRKANTVHGCAARGAKTPAYKSWKAMRDRCYRTSSDAFHNYGGRGIAICKRWEDFENFLSDMGERPEGLTLERRDNNLGYSPENCYWGTRRVQSLNRRTALMVTFNGETLNLSVWSERLGKQYDTLYMRLKHGWTVDRAFTAPIQKQNRSHP